MSFLKKDIKIVDSRPKVWLSELAIGIIAPAIGGIFSLLGVVGLLGVGGGAQFAYDKTKHINKVLAIFVATVTFVLLFNLWSIAFGGTAAL